MTELVINGQQVAMKENVSFKLTSANPYFTDNDEYSYDIELPMSAGKNFRIFGNINRFDVAKKKPEKLPARMTVDNTVVFNGYAVITAVTQDSVKVQLLGERSATNADRMYIDELDLGRFLWNSEKYSPTRYKNGGQAVSRAVNPASIEGNSSLPALPVNYEFEDPEGRWVQYPILNTSNDLVTNDFLVWGKDGGKDVNMMTIQSVYFELDFHDGRSFRRSRQPLLWWLCELIAGATGYSLDKSDNAIYNDPFFRYIFIANAFPTTLPNRMLPHWTVGEFWANLQAAFGVVVSYRGNRMKITRRSTFFSSNSEVITIDRSADEYSCDTDDDESADISSSNVAFSSFEHESLDLLDDSVLEVAAIDSSFDNLEAIRVWWKSLANALRNGYRDTIFRCKDGREYIFFKDMFDTPRFVQVNQFGPRITDSEKDDSQVELKFVPCSYHDHTVIMVDNVFHPLKKHSYIVPVKGVEAHVEILGRPDREKDRRSTVVLEEIIEGDTSSMGEEAEDVIYMGIVNGHREIELLRDGLYHLFDYPDPKSRERWIYDIEADEIKGEHAGASFSLKTTQGSQTIQSATLDNGFVIEPSIKFCVKFLSDKIPDPTKLFNIRNRLFACEKIEATFDSNGLQPMLTGYFFPAKL